MAAPPAPSPLSLEKLLESIDRLAPGQRRELERRLPARRVAGGNEVSDEPPRVRAAEFRLPAAAERRRKRAIARSERGLLTPEELVDDRPLAQEAQGLDAARAEALTEPARRPPESSAAAAFGTDSEPPA
ncbi:MAG: hypothetical protein ACYC61_29120, partial [Isosphaeraceae bacterium]